MRSVPVLIFAAAVVMVASVGTQAADLPSVPPMGSAKLVHAFDYVTVAEARQDWQPAYGNPAVDVVETHGRKVLRFPCTFEGNKLDRGCWDWPVQLDLAACRGVQLKLLCPDAGEINGFTLYFRSGDGWYGHQFSIEKNGRWCVVDFDKGSAVTEGKPAGWSKISGVRFSAWRGGDRNAEVYVADLALLGADAPIVVVKVPGEGWRAMAVLTKWLQQIDLPYFMVEPGELNVERLAKRELLVLPGPNALSGEGVVAAKSFCDAGGKVLVFGETPKELGASGVTTTPALSASADRSEQQARMAELFGKLVPDAWKAAVARRIADVGRMGAYSDLAEADAAIRALAEKVPARQQAAIEQLDKAKSLRNEAAELQKQGDTTKALSASDAARVALVDAFCLAQAALPGEHRAFWCHSAFGVNGMSWDESIRVLAENGFTAVLPNMLWGGVAYYQSGVLPVSPEVATRGDQIAECLAACKKYGLECHVWKVNFNMSGRTPREFIDRLHGEGRTQLTFGGESKEQWLCPSHPANRQLEIDAMLEVATQYAVDGIHFDYIRYPDAEGCFCAGCRERFEKAIGHAVEHWPADARQVAEIREQWLDWRQDNITAVVAGVSQRVRAAKPGVKISAAVFPIWTTNRAGIGQNWKLWCEKKYLDFICPMDYTDSVSQFQGQVRHQLEWAAGVPCYPGIGLSVWPDRNDICRLVDQIGVTRELKTGGFTIFNYAENEAKNILPMLGKGITRQ